jgi:lysophospholipase L1-like esterase
MSATLLLLSSQGSIEKGLGPIPQALFPWARQAELHFLLANGAAREKMASLNDNNQERRKCCGSWRLLRLRKGNTMKREQTAAHAILLALVGLAAGLAPVSAEDKPDSARWEQAIAAFEKQDGDKPPPKNGFVFVGSSSIRFWDLAKSFPGLDVINRGFGGSQLADSVHFAPRLVLKHEPRLVLLYAGDNDLGFGKSPEQVHADFKEFVKVVHDKLPKTRIAFLSIKPSVLRWKLIDKIRKANALIEAECKADKRLVFIDVGSVLLDDDGKPRKELFLFDGLHLNARGYELWAEVVKPYLK